MSPAECSGWRSRESKATISSGSCPNRFAWSTGPAIPTRPRASWMGALACTPANRSTSGSGRVTLHSRRWKPCEVAAAIELKGTLRNVIAGESGLRSSRRRLDAVTKLGRRALESAATDSSLGHAIELIDQASDPTSDALMTLDPSSLRFLSGTAATIAMFGARDEADLVSRAPWEYAPARQPDGRNSAELAREIGAKAVRDGYSFLELRCARIDGTEFPASVLLTRIECDGATILQATVREIYRGKSAGGGAGGQTPAAGRTQPAPTDRS